MKHTEVMALSLLYGCGSIRLHVTGGNLFGLTDSMHLPAVSAILNLDLQYSLLRMKLYIITNEGWWCV